MTAPAARLPPASAAPNPPSALRRVGAVREARQLVQKFIRSTLVVHSTQTTERQRTQTPIPSRSGWLRQRWVVGGAPAPKLMGAYPRPHGPACVRRMTVLVFHAQPGGFLVCCPVGTAPPCDENSPGRARGSTGG